jgi:hypothetical protein
VATSYTVRVPSFATPNTPCPSGTHVTARVALGRTDSARGSVFAEGAFSDKLEAPQRLAHTASILDNCRLAHPSVAGTETPILGPGLNLMARP